MLLKVFAVFFAFGTLALANASPHISAKRKPGKSYLEYKARFLGQTGLRFYSDSALVVAEKYTNEHELPLVATWNKDILDSHFNILRDHRWLISPTSGRMARRISWLYPDDGCFARAELVNRSAKGLKIPVPSKIFVFGNLNVATPNSQNGRVTWWFHVASVVEIQGQKYVLDPAIEPKKALPLDRWLERMNPNIYELEVAICQSGTYDPNSSCNTETEDKEKQALKDAAIFLQLEWQRLLDLKRDPYAELGNSPPWKSDEEYTHELLR